MEDSASKNGVQETPNLYMVMGVWMALLLLFGLLGMFGFFRYHQALQSLTREDPVLPFFCRSAILPGSKGHDQEPGSSGRVERPGSRFRDPERA